MNHIHAVGMLTNFQSSNYIKLANVIGFRYHDSCETIFLLTTETNKKIRLEVSAINTSGLIPLLQLTPKDIELIHHHLNWYNNRQKSLHFNRQKTDFVKI